jgi:hypothetical protein
MRSDKYRIKRKINENASIVTASAQLLMFFKRAMLGALLSGYTDELWPGWPGYDPRQRQQILLCSTASRPALQPTQPPLRWVPEPLSSGVKRSGTNLTANLLLRRTNGGAITQTLTGLHGVLLIT